MVRISLDFLYPCGEKNKKKNSGHRNTVHSRNVFFLIKNVTSSRTRINGSSISIPASELSDAFLLRAAGRCAVILCKIYQQDSP